jgi:tRNA-binding EMAP/Myf-like protein
MLFLTNLKPRVIQGENSEGVTVAAEINGKAVQLTLDGK